MRMWSWRFDPQSRIQAGLEIWFKYNQLVELKICLIVKQQGKFEILRNDNYVVNLDIWYIENP